VLTATVSVAAKMLFRSPFKTPYQAANPTHRCCYVELPGNTTSIWRMRRYLQDGVLLSPSGGRDVGRTLPHDMASCESISDAKAVQVSSADAKKHSTGKTQGITMRRPIHLPAAAAAGVFVTALLAGCGGGSSSNTSTPPASPSSIGGTVATGSAVSNANVQIVDVNGKSVSATSDSSGNYTASLSGLSAPLLIVATDPSGIRAALFSVLAALPGGSAPAIANVTTLTTALAAMLTTSGNPLDLSTSGSLSKQVTSSAVKSATTQLNAALAAILTPNGLNATTFDPVATPFVANQTGQDAVIDTVQVIPAPAGGIELISVADPSNAIVLNQGTTVTAPLAAAPVAANYLAPLTASLGQCLAGTTTACSQAIDSSYLENGYTSFGTAHPGIEAQGVTLQSPQTLQFFTSNGTQKALIAVPFTASDGTADSMVTVVQSTGAGGWNIVGNQQQYDITITSMVDRRQFLDLDDAPYSRYDAGLAVSISLGAPNPSNLASASLTGPGINGTAYLVPRNATGSGTLAFTSELQSAVPTGGLTSLSNTGLYRWSWQALPGVSGAYTSDSSVYGYVTPAPIDVSTVVPYATYTVTFYDSTGAQIGQPVSVTNPTVALSSAAAAGIVWHTLSADTISSVLTPGGTAAGAETTLTANWSSVVNGLNIAASVSSMQIQTAPGTGASSSSEVDGWWPGPATFSSTGQYSATATAGVDSSGAAQCSGCQFTALQAGGVRLLQLDWTAGKTSYYDIWKFND
jgi:hypothetical protein